MYTKQRLLTLLIGAALAVSVGAQAQDYPGPRQDQDRQDGAAEMSAPATQGQVDPPARVARLAKLDGSVSFTPAGENDWVQAQINRPVVTGDKLWTDRSARAELQVGASTIVLDHDSNFDFLNLDNQIAQMELTQGAVTLDVRRLRGNETYEVDTPTIAFIANRVGDYRIDVDPQGRYTVVTARRGAGDAVGEGGKRITIEEGQSVRFNDSQLVDYQVNQIGAPDDFDHYATQRVERYAQASPRGYVSEDVVGYEDLDDNGSWEDSSDYGHVWYPSGVAADWAPYHDGRWTWIDPWGWTWVGDEPWGFAPYHYGRWAYIDSRWGWVPGPIGIEPIYAPALVAFVGGGGFGVSISLGGPIGWFALGPRDVYFPGYRCGRDYFTRVNFGGTYVNRTVINNYYGAFSRNNVNYAQLTYMNRNAPRAFSAMPATAFASGRSVASSSVAVSRGTVTNARILPRATIAPTQASLIAGRGRGSAPPAAALNRHVVAVHQPAPRASFAQRQALLKQNPGQPLNTAQLHTLASRGGAEARATGNVRLVGNRGNAMPAGDAQTGAAQTNRATVSANNGRNANGSPSRAPEMNRSPAKANAQYLRSTGFAHQGVVPGSERATTAQSARERGASRAAESNRGRQNTGQTASAQSRVRSSTFAHSGPANERRSGGAAEMMQRNSAATANTRSQSTTTARGRGIAQSPTQIPRSESATSRLRSGTYGSANGRTVTSRENNRGSGNAFSRSASSSSTYSNEQRASTIRSNEPRTQNYRATEHASTYRAPARDQSPSMNRPSYQRGPSRETPSYRATEHASTYRAPAREPSPSMSRPSFQQQRAPIQSRESMHAQAPTMSRSGPPAETRAAPTYERGNRSAPTRTARQTPPRGESKKNDKDKPSGG